MTKAACIVAAMIIACSACTYHNDPIEPDHAVRSNDPDPKREIVLQQAITEHNVAKSKGDLVIAYAKAGVVAGIYQWRNDSENYVKWRNIQNQELNAYLEQTKGKGHKGE